MNLQTELAGLLVKMAGEEREREALAFDRDILRERERERERETLVAATQALGHGTQRERLKPKLNPKLDQALRHERDRFSGY